MTADHPRVILQVADVVDGFASTPRPRLTWRTETDTAEWVQAKATIEIERDGKSETAIVEGEGSVLVEWPFAPIRPRENVAVKVHVTGTNDAAGGGWSDAVDVIGGTLDEWTARFVRSDIEHPVLLRRSFRLRTGIRRATLYVSTFGAAIPRRSWPGRRPSAR